VVITPRKALADTAYRLKYANHILQNELDEIESAITEEEPKHPNIKILADAMRQLSAAQHHINETIKLL
jgi:uncharacterized protein YukE